MLTEQHGQRWLISSYGQVNWVRNLRAAGEATLQRGRQTERICAVELSAREVALYRGLGCPQLRSFMDLVEVHENQEKRKPQPSSYRDE